MTASEKTSTNRLYCLGVGHGWPTMGRNHSSYLYQLSGTNLLFDCGEPMSRTYKMSGKSFNDIDAVFLSHFHGDHVGGFFMFVQALWLEKRTRDLTIYLPGDGIEPIRKMLEVGCLFDELFSFKLNFVPLKAGQVVKVGGAKVTPFLDTHLNSFKESFGQKYNLRFEAFSFLIETEDCRIGHTADIGNAKDVEPLLQEPLDLLVCELAHFSTEDMFQYLNGKAIKQVQFVHLPEDRWNNREELARLAKKRLPKIKVGFPEDNEVVTIP